MARQGKLTAAKRNREQAQRAKNQAKAERRIQRADERQTRDAGSADEDPDIAGIVPEPQPPIWEE